MKSIFRKVTSRGRDGVDEEGQLLLCIALLEAVRANAPHAVAGAEGRGGQMESVVAPVGWGWNGWEGKGGRGWRSMSKCAGSGGGERCVGAVWYGLCPRKKREDGREGANPRGI